MKTLLKNALVLAEASKDIFEGEIVIENNKIVFVGQNYDSKVDEQIDCNKNLLMPGFINCHAHSPMVLLKGCGEGANLESWLFDYIFPKEKKMTENDIYIGSQMAINEMQKNGITTFQDCYFFPEQTMKACKENNMRAVIALSQNYSQNKMLTQNQLEQLYLSLKDESDLVDFCFYFHSVYTCDEKQILSTISLARKYNKLLGTHCSETLTEVGNCTATHGGMTPVQLLDSLGFFDVKTLLAHGVYLEKEDFEILKNKDVSIAHNPSSNLKLASGIANLKQMKNNNVNICIGTDGSASNNKLDMFREMYLSSVLQKVLMKDASLIKPYEALQMATENGAKALGFDNLGKLKENYLADIILIDMSSINNQVKNDIKSNLVYACGAEDVLMTMINGKIVYKKQ